MTRAAPLSAAGLDAVARHVDEWSDLGRHHDHGAAGRRVPRLPHQDAHLPQHRPQVRHQAGAEHATVSETMQLV